MLSANTSMNLTATVYLDTLQTVILQNVITVVLCVSINFVNGTLVHTIRNYQVLRTKPRYILYMHLVVNDIILLIALTLLHVISYIMIRFNVSLCLILLIIAIFVSLNNPLTLAAMAVECYIAICFPLRHTQICTVRKTYVIITVIWALNTLPVLPDVFVVLATESRDFLNSRVVCLRENIFREPKLTVKRDVSNTVSLVIVWLTLFYAYFRILFTAKTAAADAKKARNTVLLHGFQLLLCMLSYVFNLTIESLTYLFPQSVQTIRFTLTIFIQILPRLISPVVYGLRDKMLMKYLKKYLCCTTITKRLAK